MSTLKTADFITQEMFEISIPSYWSRDGNTAQLLQAYAVEMSEAYTNVNNLDLAVSVETATGSDLDDIGKLFKLARNDDESDDNYRARISAYWNAFTGGGTSEGIVNALSLMTGLDIDDLEVIENKTYYDIQTVNYCEATAGFTAINDANNLGTDVVTYIQGATSISFDANTGTDITCRLTLSNDFTIFQDEFFSFGFKIPNLTSLTRIELKFEDAVGGSETFYNIDVLDTNFNTYRFDLSGIPDATSGIIDWTTITRIEITAKYSGAVAYTDFLLDYLRFESYDNNMRIQTQISVDAGFDMGLLDNVNGVVQSAKAAGIHFNPDTGILPVSQSDLFLVNLSDSNGDDEI